MSSPNRFSGFSGEEIIFIYASMETFLEATYNTYLSDDNGKLTKEHEEEIEKKKHLIEELVEFGRIQGSIPEKRRKQN